LMRRLYLQIYATILGVLLLLGVLLFVSWLVSPPGDESSLEPLAAVALGLLPGPNADPEELEATLVPFHEQLGLSLAVRGQDGRLLAQAGEPLPAIERDWSGSRFLPSRGGGVTLALHLQDGRWLVVRHRRQRHGAYVLAFMLALALAVAAGAFPLVRRLTRRLERLQKRVDSLGAGDLSARVEVEGRDEIAELAGSFNRAAARIERLVEAQRMLLAGASHELRSPLARIRVALELLDENVRPDVRERVGRDIEELDEVIGELLLASRVEAAEALERSERVDLLLLAAEEAARYDVEVTGDPVLVEGDARLLRRLLRNLLDNGRRHAPGADLDVEVRADPEGGARVRVSDRGPGLSELDRERVFEPFYRVQKGPGQGSGLGLAIVRRIARLHGGDVRCLAHEGGGTTFEVRLPVEGHPHDE